jgi:hypothetical protein
MRRVLFLAAFVACASQQNNIRIVKNFREAREQGDLARAQAYIAPGARLWFENKTGPGEPYVLSGGSWDHWDTYFHSKNELSEWRTDARAVSATVNETNDFMQFLDWQAAPYTMTWWLDDQNRIAEVLIKGGGKPKSRLDEFKAWAAKNHPDELAYLMPNGQIDPTGDRPERWRAILEEWRRSAGGSPAVPPPALRQE